MSRDDLLLKNAEIVGSVVSKIVEFAPNSIIIAVTNPLDVMTYLALKKSKFDPRRVMGMAGILDTARMRTFLSFETGVHTSEIEAMVLGSHGDLMVPVASRTKIKGKLAEKVVPKDRLDAIIKRTQDGGAEIVTLLKTGSAYYAPAACATEMVEAIIRDSKATLPVCAYLSGQFGLTDICIGVPAKLGAKGIEQIVEIKLTKDEMVSLHKSAGSIKENFPKLNI
jgi:malate dehydrogenase